MPNETRYVLILETNYFGPSTSHTILRDDDGKQTPVYDSLAEAEAALPDRSGPMYVSDNEASNDLSVWAVRQEIDPTDWCGWPADLEEAATAITAEYGDDPEFDVPTLAAQKIGCCLVTVDSDSTCLLCEPLDD